VRLSRAIPFVALLSVACSGSPAVPSSVGMGIWGGDHVTLTVGDTASHLEFDCAHGDIPGVLSAHQGEIAVMGTFVREHGGPIRVDEALDSHPALYSGMLSGNTMQLSIRLTDSGDVIGSFSLARGTAGRIAKCL
jgi:hypothetical protein